MEVRLELEGHTVTDAWCVGTMFRGFEQILVGRDPGDALVIAPRICGICTHLAALRRGLGARDRLPGADRAERHAHPQPLPDGRVGHERRAPHLPDVHARLLQRRLSRTTRSTPASWSCSSRRSRAGSPRETVEHTKRDPGDRDRLRRPVAALDLHDAGRRHVPAGRGQARRVRGGDRRVRRLVRALRARLHRARSGSSLQTADDFEAWLEEPAHRDSALGVFTTFGRSIGLRELGAGHAASAERGLLLRPRTLAAAVRRAPVPPARRLLRRRARHDRAVPPRAGRRAPALLRLADPGAPRHPWDSETRPDDTDGEAYSYAKATRYDDRVVQLGPLADLVARRRPADPLAVRRRRGRRRGCGSSPACTGRW